MNRTLTTMIAAAALTLSVGAASAQTEVWIASHVSDASPLYVPK